MIPTNTREATHNFHAPKNWDAEKDGPCGVLEVRAEVNGGSQFIELVSTWKPTAEELAHLNRGGVVEIGLAQIEQCPMRAYVVDPV